jgi:hypothetical protein
LYEPKISQMLSTMMLSNAKMILFIFPRLSLNLTNISLNSSFEISYDLLFLLHVVNNPKSFYDFISEFKIITK